jgi:hypothetical protein
MSVTDCAGALATAALICAIGLPAGSFIARGSWALFAFGAFVAIISFVRDRWRR